MSKIEHFLEKKKPKLWRKLKPILEQMKSKNPKQCQDPELNLKALDMLQNIMKDKNRSDNAKVQILQIFEKRFPIAVCKISENLFIFSIPFL